MKYTMTAPCKSCPFRTDVPGFLTKTRIREIHATLLQQQQTFACHNTVDYSGDADSDEDGGSNGNVTDESQHCAGAMILLERLGRPNQMMRICERLGMYDRTKLKMDAPVFDSCAAMVAHHGRK